MLARSPRPVPIPKIVPNRAPLLPAGGRPPTVRRPAAPLSRPCHSGTPRLLRRTIRTQVSIPSSPDKSGALCRLAASSEAPASPNAAKLRFSAIPPQEQNLKGGKIVSLFFVLQLGALGMATLGASAMPAGSSGGDGEVEAGFAKLQGEDFEYYMQTYSIMLGRNSKKSTVDVDLSSLGGGMNISRHHARIFYDFQRRRFALDVIGKNGCLVEGVLHLPGNPPVKLDSQDLLQIGDKKFYFLLPTRSIFASAAAARHAPIIPPQLPPPSYVRPGRPRLSDFHERSFESDYGRDSDDIGNGISEGGMRGKLIKRSKKLSGESDIYGGHRINVEAIGTLGEDNRSEIRSRGDRDMDSQHILQAEEKDVVSSVATVLSDLCGPGEWMPMAKLHTELVEHFGNVWHHSRVRKYLTPEDWSPTETKGRPWYGLLALLRKYPEHFVINTRSKGRVTSEFVSLVSLLS